MDWCGSSTSSNSNGTTNSHALVVTERGSRVVVYDTRKLTSSKASVGSNSKQQAHPAILHVSEPRSKEIIETAIFGPGNGKYLISASQLLDKDTTSDLCIWDWTKDEKRPGDTNDNAKASELRFPAHMEAIYTMALSPNGKCLATGGADAIVGLWDTDTMVCTHTIRRRTKYIRAVAFSPDGHVVAHATEENDIELAAASNGQLIGSVSLGHRRGGAEAIAFHPTQPLLACARMDMNMPNTSPVAIAKLNISGSPSQ